MDDLDQLKLEHYSEVLENEQEMWNSIADKTALIVKSEVDVFDRIVTKGSIDPVLESVSGHRPWVSSPPHHTELMSASSQMQQANPDPFGAYVQEGDPAAIFSVLPATSILSTAGPSQARPTQSRTPSSAHVPFASPQLSESTAQAEPRTASVQREQWTRPLSAISESTPARRSRSQTEGIDNDNTSDKEQDPAAHEGDRSTEDQQESSGVRSTKSSDGPPIEGGSSAWAS